MKKDETLKVKIVKDRGALKNETKIQGEKNNSQKPFLGCDTCKSKQVLPFKKDKLFQENQEKLKKCLENNNYNVKRTKITLTDLCEEDKKRIVELMEELAKFAEKNKTLKESLDFSEKSKQEQHDCLVKQTNLYLEEKNIFLKEIQACKAKLELYEDEMKDKITKWGARERLMDNEIRCLTKALQKSFIEKNDLMKEIGNLKACLKQSLESFELLRSEVAALQKASSGTTKSNASSIRLAGSEKGNGEAPHRVEESEDEYMSTTKEPPPQKANLELINDKLEQLYALFKNRASTPPASTTAPGHPPERANYEKCETRTPEEAKIEKEVESETEVKTEAEVPKTQNAFNLYPIKEDCGEEKNDSNYKFLKPFNKFSKTSIQAERKLKKIEKPFWVGFNEKIEDIGEKKLDHFDEDRLLSELFYSDNILDLEIASALLLADKNEHRYHHH